MPIVAPWDFSESGVTFDVPGFTFDGGVGGGGGGGGGGGSAGGALTFSLPDPFNFPILVPATGLQPLSPVQLLSNLLTSVSATTPGYTPNLPGSVIENFSSVDVAAMAVADQGKIEVTNSFTPYGANPFLLQQMGAQFGTQLNSVTNTTVNVVFNSTTIGYVISQGFLVSDGFVTYIVRDGGVIQSTGLSLPLVAISLSPGSFDVPQDSVTTLGTTLPGSIALTVNNPTDGTPGSDNGEAISSYRSRILQSASTLTASTAQYLKTLLKQIPGVAINAISVQQVAGGGFRIVASGADQYAIAYAIFMAVSDVGFLVGSAIDASRNVTSVLTDYPDTYSVVYVQTQTQTVSMAVTWNTTLAGFTGGGAFVGLAQAPLAAYINALAPGEIINVLEMNEIFQVATSGVLDPELLTRLVFTVSINGVQVPQTAGTYAISGDPESNFSCTTGNITVIQG